MIPIMTPIMTPIRYILFKIAPYENKLNDFLIVLYQDKNLANTIIVKSLYFSTTTIFEMIKRSFKKIISNNPQIILPQNNLLKITWYDEHKLNNYLNTLDDQDKNFVNIIINKSLYFNTTTIFEMIKRSFKKFISKNPKYNILIPNEKIGSEHYFFLQLYNEIMENKPSIIIYDQLIKIDNNYPIIIIDDVIYSSINMCSHIDGLKYDYKNKFNTKLKNQFVCITAIVSTENVQVVTDFGALLLYDFNAETLLPKNIFGHKEINNQTLDEYLFEHFGCESDLILPIVLQHKIANNFGCYQFFHNLLSVPINRNAIDQLTKSDIVNFISKITKNQHLMY